MMPCHFPGGSLHPRYLPSFHLRDSSKFPFLPSVLLCTEASLSPPFLLPLRCSWVFITNAADEYNWKKFLFSLGIYPIWLKKKKKDPSKYRLDGRILGLLRDSCYCFGVGRVENMYVPCRLGIKERGDAAAGMALNPGSLWVHCVNGSCFQRS